MRLEPYSRYGEIRFVVHAENDADRAILSLFTSVEYRCGRDLAFGGHTYSCDYSAVTDFNFGWMEPPLQTKKRRHK